MSVPTSTTTTTTWPWLSDGMTMMMIADPPIPPIDSYDDRPSVVSLISEHRTVIDKVRSALLNDPLYDSDKHDDLWILRFVLSHKRNVTSAVRAAKYTLAFRKKHQLDEKDIRYMSPSENESLQRYMKYVRDDAIRLVVPDRQRSVILFIDIGGVNQHGLAANVKESDWLPSYLHYNEMAFQWIDSITRTTGRLTKLVRIIDGRNIQWNALSIECSRRDGVVMKLTEDCYPQLLAGMYICDAPSYIQVPWRMIRPLFPPRVLQKFDFISSPNTNHHSVNQDYQRLLLPHICEDHIPSRYGGLYKPWPVEFTLPSSSPPQQRLSPSLSSPRPPSPPQV